MSYFPKKKKKGERREERGCVFLELFYEHRYFDLKSFGFGIISKHCSI
jgi:hypothetical protein